MFATHTFIHGDGNRPIERVLRHPHEWELAEFTWDPKSGVAVCVYERTVDGALECTKVMRAQPAARTHSGWRLYNGRFI